MYRRQDLDTEWSATGARGEEVNSARNPWKRPELWVRMMLLYEKRPEWRTSDQLRDAGISMKLARRQMLFENAIIRGDMFALRAGEPPG